MRPSYSSVVATLALFIALGSTGVAAPVTDGVRSAANDVTRALGLSKQANENSKRSLATARRANRNAKAALAKGGPTGPAGPRGAPASTGDKGAQGEQGLKGATGDKGADGDPATTASFATNAGLLDDLDSTHFARSSLFGGGGSGGDVVDGSGTDCTLGDVWLFAGNFAPTDTHFADGSLIAIEDNDPLFNLIGTLYGGDGENNFALPDLRDATPNSTGAAPLSYVVCIEGNFPSRP